MKTITGFALALALSFAFLSVAGAKDMNKGAKLNLDSLMSGNARYAAGEPTHPRQGMERRKEVTLSQHPAAIVVSCSDSRVPPEIIFDQGVGDLFVVRVAGNVLNDVNTGSVEYAAEHFNVPLVIVLGHERCGAVTATVKGGEAPWHIGSIVEAILPAVAEAKKCCSEGDLVEAAAHINVERAVKALRDSNPILSHLVKKGKLTVIGAYYDLDSGKVELLP